MMLEPTGPPRPIPIPKSRVAAKFLAEGGACHCPSGLDFHWAVWQTSLCVTTAILSVGGGLAVLALLIAKEFGWWNH